MGTNEINTIELTVIAPVHNEAAGLEHFHSSLIKELKNLDLNFEIIYVDDGSTDGSTKIIQRLAKADSKIKPLFLSRNFGKESATTAGLHFARGKAAIILDADGQHPVEEIHSFIKKWRAGAQVVVGVRTSNQQEGFIKRLGSKSFYRMLYWLGVRDVVPGSTDFRLVDRQVISNFNKLTEHNRVTRALIDWLGYNKELIYFSANARLHGEASYSHKKLLQLALNGFVSLSFTPLYLSGYTGAVITFFSTILGIFAVTEQYILGDPLSLGIKGTAILAILILFLVGILLIGQGLLAIYVARIYTEVQNRPLYLVKE